MGPQPALGRRILGTLTTRPYQPSRVRRAKRDGRDALCASVTSGLSRRRRSKSCAVLGAVNSRLFPNGMGLL
jgi:hypothetical protein